MPPIAVNAAWEVSRVDLDYTVASLQAVDAIIEAGQVGPQLERCRRVEQLGPLEPAEARDFYHFLRDAVDTKIGLQLMYSIDGRAGDTDDHARAPRESQLAWLAT